MLRNARGRIEDRRVESRLILWQQAVAAAEDKVVFAQDDIDGSHEEWRWRNDGAEGEEFAERLGLLVGDADGEIWSAASERGYKSFLCVGAKVLTLGFKVGPAVVGELDRLLKRLHQVAVAEAGEFARGVCVCDGKVEGCQGRVHKGGGGGGAGEDDGVKVFRVLGRNAVCDG